MLTEGTNTGKAVTSHPRLVLFSDLDGTLLDEHSYSWEPARPALGALQQLKIPLVLCSSKTQPEMAWLQAQLHIRHPFIAENGASVVIPRGYFEPGFGIGARSESGPDHSVPFGSPRPRILEILEHLKERGFRFRGFNDLTCAELAQISGLSEAEAARAKQRVATEPLLWDGDADSLASFRTALRAHQLMLVEGGRFFHVMGRFDKADAMEYLLERYRILYHGDEVTSVALGDAPNDVRMLEHADIAVVIARDKKDKLELSPAKHVLRSRAAGPAGWNECVMQVLETAGFRNAEPVG